MSEKRRRLNAVRAALLVAAAAGSVALACDAPVPMEVREAFAEAMADQRVQRTEAEMQRRSARLQILRDFVVTGRGRDSGPAVYLDGVRVPGPREMSDGEDPLSRLDPHDIARIEVLKGPAARELYGEEAAGGVIEIFTNDAEDGSGEAARAYEAYEEANRSLTEGAEPELELEVEELVVTVQPQAELVAKRQVEVTAQALAKSLRSLRELKVKAMELLVTGSRPVVYVDGVRVDEAGLDKVLRDIPSDRIDRIEVEKGEVAEKLYGSEAAHGVIHIHTLR